MDYNLQSYIRHLVFKHSQILKCYCRTSDVPSGFTDTGYQYTVDSMDPQYTDAMSSTVIYYSEKRSK